MKRTAINPWAWSLKHGYNQAEMLNGVGRYLVCAGQTAVDAEGNPLYPGDMRSQFALALDNLEAVLNTAGMGLGDVVHLKIYATDVEDAMRHFDILGTRFGAVDSAPPMTVLGVTGLAIPPLMVEIEATAAD